MGLMKKADIARLFGVSRQAVGQLISRSAVNGFPEPVRAGVWRESEVFAWKAARDAGEADS